MLNKLTKEITIMKNFMNYICLFLMILGINVNVNADISGAYAEPSEFTVTSEEGTVYLNIKNNSADGWDKYYNYYHTYYAQVISDDLIVYGGDDIDYWFFTPTYEHDYVGRNADKFPLDYYFEEQGDYTATIRLYYWESGGEIADQPHKDINITIHYTGTIYNFIVGNNNTFSCGEVTAGCNSSNHSLTVGSLTELPIAIPCEVESNVGWTFDGWSETHVSKGSTTYTKVTLPYSGSATEFYAVYKLTHGDKSIYASSIECEKHTLTYDANGGQNAPVDENEYAFGETVTVLGAGLMTYAQHIFLGWSTNSTATEAQFLPGQETSMGTTNATLYAIWKEANLTNYQTYCPRTVSFDLNELPGEAPADIVTKKNLTITAPEDPVTPEGLTFIGWYNRENDQKWNFATDVVTDDMILYAKCRSALTISGDVHLTSSKDVQVYTTPATSNMISVRWLGKDEPLATKIRFSYYLNGEKVIETNSPFRVCDTTSYNMIDRVDNEGDDFEQTFAVSYKPTVYNQLDNYTIRVEAVNDDGKQIYRTADLAVYGRSLPEQFVIAMKNTNDNKWYALPNDLATSTSESSSTKAPLLISVDNTTAPTKALMAPKNTLYKGDSRYKATKHRNAIRFLRADATDNAWITTSSTSLLYMPNNGADKQQFNLLSSDLAKYTVTQDSATKTIAMDGGIIGWYGSSNNTVYLLPVDANAEPAVFDVVEWFPTKLLIESSQDITNTSVKVGDAEAVVGTASTTTYGTNLYEVQTGDLTAKAGQAMSVSYTIETTTYAKVVTVPIILSRGTYATSGSVLGGLSAQSKYQENDLVVRDGATLTVDAPTGTWNKFVNVTIYPKSKVIVPAKTTDEKEVTMTTTTMTLFGGRDEIYDGSKYSMTTYAVPQLVLKGKLVHEATVQGLRYDMRVDDAIYYDFALPYESMYELVSDHKGAYDYKYWVKNYNGAARATGATGWTWYDWNADPWKINIGTGYLLAAQSKEGQNYVIMRHPMGYYDTGEDKYAKNPKGHQTGTAEETKAAITVEAYPSSFDSNVGWNFIANPFMANFQLDQDGEETGTIKTGELVEHKVNDKWDGHYDWADNENKNVRYVTTYSYETGEYTQHKMSETALPPFTGFFVQIAKKGTIVFDIAGRADAAPARMLSDDELPSEIEVTLKVNGQNESDETVMLLTKDLSRSNAREFPDEQTKMVNDGILNYYTYGGEDTKMYANGMNYEEGQEWNKAGIMVKTAGEYTFSVNGINENYVEQVILKDMDSNTEYDLMSNDAKIYLDKGEMNDRFYVKIVFGKHNIGTGITERYDTSAPEKFILNDHMYIRANGVLFDGVGKRVKY